MATLCKQDLWGTLHSFKDRKGQQAPAEQTIVENVDPLPIPAYHKQDLWGRREDEIKWTQS